MSNKQNEAIIAEILDKLIDLHEGSALVFKNELQKKHFYFEFIHKRDKSYRVGRNCIYPECSDRSVTRSHSIQRATSLSNISEGDHVLQPLLDEGGSELRIVMKKVGINDASTFPGFCKIHEKIFADFEKQGIIDTLNHAKLQTFRNICREIVFREHELTWNKRSLDNYISMQKESALAFVQRELRERGIKNDIANLKLSMKDEFIFTKEGLIKYSEKELKVLRKYFEYLYADICGNKASDHIAIRALNIDIKFPVSLCGIANASFNIYGKEQNVFVIMSVLPSANNSTIICAALKEHEIVLDSYFKFYSQNNCTVLSMIESFMIHGSDHWFITPSIWNNLSKEKQGIILTDLLHTQRTFLDQFPLSIFDDIRASFVVQLENQNSLCYSDNISTLINQEKKKFMISNHPGIANEETIIQYFRDKILKQKDTVT